MKRPYKAVNTVNSEYAEIQQLARSNLGLVFRNLFSEVTGIKNYFRIITETFSFFTQAGLELGVQSPGAHYFITVDLIRKNQATSQSL